MHGTIKLKYVCRILDEFRRPISAEKRNQNSDTLYDYYGASGAIDKIDGYTIDDHVMLIGEDGANLVLRNLPLMYEVNGKAWINNHAHILKPIENVDFDYLFFALENADIFPFVTGSAQPKLNQENLKLIPVPITDYLTQKRIAAFVKSKSIKIDSLVSDIQKQIDTLEEYKRSVITEAVTKGLDPDVEMRDSGVQWIGMIPKHWSLYRMATLYTERNERGSEELPLLSVSINTGVSDTELSDEESQRVFVRSEDRTKYKRVYPQDLTYNMMRAWQGAFGAVRVNGMVSPAYVVAKPLKKIDTRYIEALLRTPSAIQEMHRYSYGVADFRLRLYWDKFRTIKVCFPPLEEQHKIADYIDEKANEIDTIIATKQRQIETIEEYKKSLIFEYVTGKKEVQ